MSGKSAPGWEGEKIIGQASSGRTPGESGNLSRPVFAVALGLILILLIIYLANMIQWREAPEVGWNPLRGLGPNVVGITTPLGEQAGLRPSDRILEINGRTYDSYDGLRELTDFRVGAINEYLIRRGDHTLTVSVVTARLGFRKVLTTSGIYWFLGTVFLAVGAIVFLMKPGTTQSWAFYLMCGFLSVVIPYFNNIHYYSFQWLDKVLLVAFPAVPASIIHLALVFPKRSRILEGKERLLFIPYSLSAVLAAAMLATGSRIATVPDHLMKLLYTYILVSLILLLGLALRRVFVSDSQVVRLQSLVIFTGFVLAMFVPMVELGTNMFFKISLVPNIQAFYLVFFLLFPLSIGYAIVRHDLFEVDTIVRRTYGYILSTASILIFYGLFVTVLNMVFQGSDLSRTPMFSILFALIVVFTFRPVHERIQNFVDRVFYRQRYDYRKTIHDISESLLRILDPAQIHRTLIGSVVREMFLENGSILLLDPGGTGCKVKYREGFGEEDLTGEERLESGDIVEVLRERGDALFRHEVELNPGFDGTRDLLLPGYDELGAEVMLPLKYEDGIRGFVSFGPKKSGKMFTSEDVDLLRTITNQGAVALENARLFEENLEKGRMEEELKIARDLQTSMLPESPPDVEGFGIAARSIQAGEVGGDFYDFLQTGDSEHGRVGIVVADVSGKAVSGALVMSAARSIFRVLSSGDNRIEDVMRRGNARLKGDVKKGMFVALLYAVIDPSTRLLSVANAGQTEPILRREKTGEVVLLGTEGDRFPLGVVENCDYRQGDFELQPGDTVVLYTDGVVEAMNGEGQMYGFDRFMELIGGMKGMKAGETLSIIMEDIEGFVGDVKQHDDITVVVVQASH